MPEQAKDHYSLSKVWPILFIGAVCGAAVSVGFKDIFIDPSTAKQAQVENNILRQKVATIIEAASLDNFVVNDYDHTYTFSSATDESGHKLPLKDCQGSFEESNNTYSANLDSLACHPFKNQ